MENDKINMKKNKNILMYNIVNIYVIFICSNSLAHGGNIKDGKKKFTIYSRT